MTVATGTDGVKVSASGNGTQTITRTTEAAAVSISTEVMDATDKKLDAIREARMKGYEGDACGECGNFTLVRNGTCLKCDTCGGTSGCS